MAVAVNTALAFVLLGAGTLLALRGIAAHSDATVGALSHVERMIVAAFAVALFLLAWAAISPTGLACN